MKPESVQQKHETFDPPSRSSLPCCSASMAFCFHASQPPQRQRNSHRPRSSSSSRQYERGSRQSHFPRRRSYWMKSKIAANALCCWSLIQACEGSARVAGSWCRHLWPEYSSVLIKPLYGTQVWHALTNDAFVEILLRRKDSVHLFKDLTTPLDFLSILDAYLPSDGRWRKAPKEFCPAERLFRVAVFTTPILPLFGRRSQASKMQVQTHALCRSQRCYQET